MKTPLHVGWSQHWNGSRASSSRARGIHLGRLKSAGFKWESAGCGQTAPLRSMSSFGLSLREISWNDLPEEQSAALTRCICIPPQTGAASHLPISPTLKQADLESNVHKNHTSGQHCTPCCDPRCARPSPSGLDLPFLVPNSEKKKKQTP